MQLVVAGCFHTPESYRVAFTRPFSSGINFNLESRFHFWLMVHEYEIRSKIEMSGFIYSSALLL